MKAEKERTESTRRDGLRVKYHATTPGGVILQSGVRKSTFEEGRYCAWWTVGHQTFSLHPARNTRAEADFGARMAMIALRTAAGIPDDPLLHYKNGKEKKLKA